MSVQIYGIIIVCLVVVLSLQGLVFASAGDNGLEKEVDGIEVELLFMKSAFETGNNEICKVGIVRTWTTAIPNIIE